MSNYGPPPPSQPDQPGQNPYGQPPQQNPYGQQPASQTPYGANPYGSPAGYAGQGSAPYAHWGKRVGAYLIDALVTALAYIPAVIGLVIMTSGLSATTDSTGRAVTTGSINPVGLVILILGIVVYLGFVIWNFFIKQGRTGYTIGKGVLGIKLVGEATNQPIGAGMAFVRQIVHILDSFCFVGYLWPLWDAKRQTFADKILNTVVLDQPK